MACKCKGVDEGTGRERKPEQATCGNCNRSWCFKCDPCPSAMCHWCNGRGYSTAPLTADGKRKRVRTPKWRLKQLQAIRGIKLPRLLRGVDVVGSHYAHLARHGT